MKDIDFDELDKAVSSLMKPSGQGSAGESKPSETTSQNSDSRLEEPTPQVLSTPEVPALKADSVPSGGVVRRSSGRFMDVVHPSSDMRSTTPSVSTPARSGGITPPRRSSALAAPAASAAVGSKEEAPKSKPEEPSKDMEFPDPIDIEPMVGAEKEAPAEEKSPEVVTTTLAAEEDKPAAEDAKPVTPDDESDDSDILESLFLPNVKVEKRPLGMSAADTPVTEESAEIPEIGAVEKEEKPSDTLVTPDPTLAELGDDVLAIESDAGTPSGEDHKTDSVDQSAESPTGAALATSAISSIPRQYSVKPSSDDKHHEALYDTAAQAGAPLQHPAKSKSGWMVVLWVLLLIVVGVGGGLALYFLNVF